MAISSADVTNKCAACGKEDGGGDGGPKLKACAACKMVKYCNASCQRAHRPLHKKACKRRAAELRDEALFREPPPPDDCPICFLPISVAENGHLEILYKPCCGKSVCGGCELTIFENGTTETDLCAFCREPRPTREEALEQAKKRMALGDAAAFNYMAELYCDGNGVPRDHRKALELWERAGELGSTVALHNIGCYSFDGTRVNKDMKKARQCWEHAAIQGYPHSRHSLGDLEWDEGDHKRAMKHFIIAARSGFKLSLDVVQDGFRSGTVTKPEFDKALRAFQRSVNEAKSEQRDKYAEYQRRRGFGS